MDEEVIEESSTTDDTKNSSCDGREWEEPAPPSNPAESFDSFECCICLDLIYKPVVVVCGHISCFWCIHHAMDGTTDSNCPICRKPYRYFPAICQLLHNLLRKSKPADYKKREEEVLNTEREKNCFSPQFIEDIPCHENGEPPQDGLRGEASARLSISDALCAGCGQLLFRPRVLNCGHTYCELCAVSLGRDPLRCRVCQGVHPGEPPQVCLPLDAFLENRFPHEYASRRAFVQPRLPSSASQAEQPVRLSTHEDPQPAPMEQFRSIHDWVGCDSCGMYPITGKRYRCTDCEEAIGFDLCEACYEARSNLRPRFNQRHTPDHTFVLELPRPRRWFQGGSAEPDVSDGAAYVLRE